MSYADELFLADAQEVIIANKEVITTPGKRYPIKPIVKDELSYPFTEGGDNVLFLRRHRTDY